MHNFFSLMQSYWYESNFVKSLQNIKSLRHSYFLKNVTTVMSGTAIAQLIGFLMMPVISRLYKPSDFGVYGSFNSILTIISVVGTLQYSQAIMLPKRNKDAMNVFHLSCLCVLLVFLLSSLVVIIAPSSLLHLIKNDNVWLLVLLLLGVLVNSLNQILQSWCIRVKSFKHTSASQVIRSLSLNGLWIGFGMGHVGAIGLVFGSVLGNAIASLNLAGVCLKDVKKIHSPFNFERVKHFANEYRDFPMYSAPQSLINALSQGLPVLFLAYFYGVGISGAYVFGIGVLYVPIRFVLIALRQVLFQKGSETHNDGGKLYPLFLKTTVSLMAISFFPAIIIFVWAPHIFSFLFGHEWFEAGTYARWLIPWMAVEFCNVPSIVFARVTRQQKAIFLFDFVLLLCRISCLVLGGKYLSPIGTIIVFSIIGAIFNGGLVIWMGHILSKMENNNFRSIQKAV